MVLKCLDDEIVIDFIMRGGADEGGASVTEEYSYWWERHTRAERYFAERPNNMGQAIQARISIPFSPASESEPKRLSRSTAT